MQRWKSGIKREFTNNAFGLVDLQLSTYCQQSNKHSPENTLEVSWMLSDFPEGGQCCGESTLLAIAEMPGDSLGRLSSPTP